MRYTVAVFVVLSIALPARGQYLAFVNLERVNRRLSGHVVDCTQNHGSDRRILSPIPERPRDLYVYLPPGYEPGRAYPLVVYFHMAYVDEHFFVGSGMLEDLDGLILRGECPPVVVACPDATYGGRDKFSEIHSFYVNGLGGRFEDHIFREVIAFLEANYAIRPEREAHALLGTSAGGYGAMSLAIRHRDTIGAVATLAGPLNMRYSNVDGVYFEDFNPAGTDHEIRANFDREAGATCAGWARFRMPGAFSRTARHAGECAE
jgi:S-formylglutathione hydrolase FrmB